MFPRTNRHFSKYIFSNYTTPPARGRPERRWMCFLIQSNKQKYRAFRHLHHPKTHFRQMANHRKALYLSHFSDIYLFFTFDINTTHSTWLELMELIDVYGLFIPRIHSRAHVNGFFRIFLERF